MRTAEETRKLIEQLSDSQAQEQLKEIEAQIDSEIFNPDLHRKPTKIFYLKELHSATKTILERLGYSIKENYSQREGDCTTISWETINEK